MSTKSDQLIFEPSKKELASSRLGRRRALQALSGALFGGVASTLVAKSPAYAAACSTNSPGSGCYGFNKCNCCSATSCCASGCTAYHGVCSSGPLGGGSNYWYTCQGGYVFACADFTQSCDGRNNPCICRFYIGRC